MKLQDAEDEKIWLFVFAPARRPGKKGKVVVQPQFDDRLHFGLHPKNRFISHSVRSGGYVDASKLGERRYKPVLG